MSGVAMVFHSHGIVDTKTHLRIFQEFRVILHEFCQFEDARSIQMSSVRVKILKDNPSTRIKVKNIPI